MNHEMTNAEMYMLNRNIAMRAALNELGQVQSPTISDFIRIASKHNLFCVDLRRAAANESMRVNR